MKLLAGHPEICLYQPEIPQNTGSIGRLAAATGSRLHLVRPFGFSLDDRNLRRPGLDYWPFLDLEIHDDLDALIERFPSHGATCFFSKKGVKPYTEMPKTARLFVFGRETTGLPESLFDRFPDAFYQIPIYHPGVRSLNLANAAAIIVYEHLRRQNAEDFGDDHHA